NGHAETVNAFTAAPAGTGVIDNTSASAASFTFGAGNGAVSIAPTGAGTFTIKNTGGGALSLTKTGTAAATIAANATLNYTGTTNVNAGSLTINAPLNGTKGLSSSGTGILNTVGAVNFAANSSISATGGAINVL